MKGWKLLNEFCLNKRFDFPDFKKALKFVNEISLIINLRQHYPEILFTDDKVEINLWTQKVNSITARDFELAEHFDRVYEAYKK